MLKISNFDNYLFDFDGTIADSNKLHEIAFKKVFKKNNIDKMFSFSYEKIKGLKTSDSLKKIGLKRNILKIAQEKKLFYRKNINNVYFFKNANKTINLLKKNKKKIYIVSGGSKKNILFLLKKNRVKVDGIISAEDIKYSKPNKQAYEKCLKIFNLDSKKSVAIEDAYNGVLSAKRNKIKTIGINNLLIKNKVNYFFKTFSYFYLALKKQ